MRKGFELLIDGLVQRFKLIVNFKNLDSRFSNIAIRGEKGGEGSSRCKTEDEIIEEIQLTIATLIKTTEGKDQ